MPIPTEISVKITPFKIYRDYISDNKVVFPSDTSVKLNKTLLFSDNYQCALFNVYLAETQLTNGENDVTLIFDGIYKRKSPHTIMFEHNGEQHTAKINYPTSGDGGYDGGGGSVNPPLVQDVSLVVNNRQSFNFNAHKYLFENAFFSLEDKALSKIKFTTDYSRLKYDGVSYNGQFISINDFDKLEFEAVDIDSPTSYAMFFKAQDEDGNTSESAIFYLSVGAYSTILWENIVVFVDGSTGLHTTVDMNYVGATGQVVHSGENILFASDGIYVNLSINEDKVLNGTGTLSTFLDVESDGFDGTYNYNFELYGSGRLRIIYRNRTPEIAPM